MGKLVVVVGGQFGSEGKGRVAGDLAEHYADQDVFAIRVGGPNAGHCVVRYGKEWKLRTLPTAVVTNPKAKLGIAPGSEVDFDLLSKEITEIQMVTGLNVSNRFYIDSKATVLTDQHKQTERDAGLLDRVASTGSGTGAARVDRLMRNARQVAAGWDVTGMAIDHLREGGLVLVEGCQGYGLGLHAGYYPKCSSADFRAIDALAMAGLSPWAPWVSELEVWVVFRTFPIRVGGDSGPLVGESSWGDLGLDEERTTVTNKVRRVGEWDSRLANQAIRENGGSGCRVALTMVDQVNNLAKGATETNEYIEGFCKQIELDLEGAKVCLVGTGKTTSLWRQ